MEILVDTNKGLFRIDAEKAVAQGCGSYVKPISFASLCPGMIFRFKLKSEKDWEPYLWRVVSRTSEIEITMQVLGENDERGPLCNLPKEESFHENNEFEFAVLTIDGHWETTYIG